MPTYRVEQGVTVRVTEQAPDRATALHDAEHRLRRRLPMAVPENVVEASVTDTVVEQLPGPGEPFWVSAELVVTVAVDAVDGERAGQKARATVASLCADLGLEDWTFAAAPAVEPA